LTLFFKNIFIFKYIEFLDIMERLAKLEVKGFGVIRTIVATRIRGIIRIASIDLLAHKSTLAILMMDWINSSKERSKWEFQSIVIRA
jgi:hypothetical protein